MTDDETVGESPASAGLVLGCPVIDAHTHLLPTKLQAAVSDWFRDRKGWEIPKREPETVVQRLSEWTNGFVFFPYAHRPGVSSSLNDFAADWQSRLDGAIGLGTVHAADESPKQVVTDLLEKGLRGVKIHCPVQGFSVDDRRLDPVYELLVESNAPLVVHASTHPFYRDDPDLGAGHMRRVLDRFPSLRVCVPHLGLFETTEFLDLMDRYEVYLDTAIALGPETQDLIGLQDGELPVETLQSYGDRIMFGSDYPVRPQPYWEAFRTIQDQFPDQYRDIFYGNATRFFGFEPENSATEPW